jgi:hypothetical protein
MTFPRPRAGSIRRCLTTVALAGAAAGCGADADYANDPRPPAPINVTALIDDRRVEVSPRSFGAGPIILTIANESSRSQEITLETDEIDGDGPGLRQRTSPVNPSGTASLKVDVDEGRYRLGVASPRIRSASVLVGERRPSAQNELLQP